MPSLIKTLPALPARLAAWTALALALALPASALRAEEPIYAVGSLIVPSQGRGGFSPQRGVKPEVRKDEGGRMIAIDLPAQGGRSASVAWWYAQHFRKKLPAEWPSGEDVRMQVVLNAASDTVVNIDVALQTEGGSVKGSGAKAVTLPAGRDVAVYSELPSKLPGTVTHVTVVLSAKTTLPDVSITGWSVGQLADAALEVPGDDVWITAQNPVVIKGRAVGDAGQSVTVQVLDADKKQVAELTAPLAADGSFTLPLDRTALPLCQRLSLVPVAPGKAPSPGDYSFFTFPMLDPDKRLARVEKQGSHLVLDGKPWAFLGTNYTPFMLGLSRKADHELVARNFRELHEWGFTAIRVPLAMAMIQPAPGVFPDSPEYKTILRDAGLDPRFFELLRYTVALGHHFGIRVVFDWHESAMDPYRYFTGGDVKDRGTGKPGSPLAWLAMPADRYPKEDHPVFVLIDEPRQVKALLDTTAWIAAAFKGDGAVLGFEVPYNEPHERLISNDRNWRRLTAQAALSVKQSDPGALTFAMPAGWGHENVFVSSTWLIPDLVDGMAPHFYVGNGPIPVRDDASKRKYPYLAREVEPSLSLGLAALSLPYSTAGYPFYNGEGGGHGAESFLPDLPLDDATRIMIEAQVFQTFATGMAGYFEWTMWNFGFWRNTTVPNKELFQRYSPVFAAGPLDLGRARVLFVQNPAAETNANGHNHAAVRFARIALDLHLQPVHYMTDQQLIYTGQTMFSRGFEQVDASGEGLGAYQAIMVDTRNVDKRALDIVRGAGVPVIEFTEDKPVEVAAAAEFLRAHNVPHDTKTSAQFQYAEGPAHLVVYRRSAGDAARVHPTLHREGVFALIDEAGRTVFTGDAAKLAADGLAVNLAPYVSAIFRIEPTR